MSVTAIHWGTTSASGAYYRAAFQGNNLVYVAAQP